MRQLLAKNFWLFNCWAFFAAFTTYFFMYMFRKPFTAAAFGTVTDSIWDGKSVLVSAQVIGYLCSKLVGIRFVSAMPAGKRAYALIGLISVAHVALLFFAVLPAPWHVLAIFFNGLPLGMVFGLVLGFLEGRRVTEALVAGLCASFILAGGVSKSVGQGVMTILVERFDFDMVSAERWMPFISGSLFLLPFALTTWMLAQIPDPSESDTEARSKRTAMTDKDRRNMLARYGIGLAAVSVVYLLVTILRSLRDDFAPQILAGMGATVKASDYSLIDVQVALFVLVVNGLTALVKNNRLALQISLLITLAGLVLIAVSLSISTRLSPSVFMVMVGTGLYLPYVAVHTTIFERLIALTRDRGNIGFLMYVVDSLGYFGYVVILFLPDRVVIGQGNSNEACYSDFRWFCWWLVCIGLFATMVAMTRFLLMKSADRLVDEVS